VIVLAAIGITSLAWLRQPKKAAFEEIKHLKSSGWLLSGDSPTNYEMGVDQQVSYRGSPSAYLKAKQPFTEGYGTMMQQFSPGQYAGKRVRLSAFVKAEEVSDWAGLWMRVEKGPTIVGFDNMQDRPIKGTTTWRNYEVVLDVPPDATKIAYGILLSQSGTVWLNGVKFESVGPTNVPLQDAGPLSGIPNPLRK
jgi:hypothetical protein